MALDPSGAGSCGTSMMERMGLSYRNDFLHSAFW